MKNCADVIIVGSGIVGNSAAYYCAKKGLSVIVLDRDIVGNGASCRNGGGVRASGRDEREIPLAKYAIDHIWPGLDDELGVDTEFEQGGNLRIAAGKQYEDVLYRIADNCRKNGLAIDLLDRKQAKELCPSISETVTLATFCPTDGHANPLKTTLGFYKKARELGAVYYTGEEVVELQQARGRVRRVVTASGRVYEGVRVILAAGYETRRIANTVGVDMPFRQKLIEVFVTEAAPPMFDFMMSSADGAFYGHQTENGSFIFGGDSGYEHHPVFQEEALCLQQTAPAIARGVLLYFPDLADYKIIRTWAGWIDLCSDLVPVIGEAGEVPGLYVAAGYSAHGFCLGPVTGKILSQMAAGEPPCVDCTPLRYDRFQSCQ